MTSPLGVPKEVTEYFDTPKELEEKIKRLAELVRKSQHIVYFTGAGLSTSAGIPDFRGPQGVWTLREKGIKATRPIVTEIQPTKGHMSIMKFFETEKMKYLISQNTDGLHVRSGIPITAISELHGNSNIEKCENCEISFWRKFQVREAAGVNQHETSRKCDYCGTRLEDTIVNFGEGLPERILQEAYRQSGISDLHIVLGSSLTVTPANELPQITVRNGKPLVIVNLQKTPLDNMATLRIFAKTDDVLMRLSKELGYDEIREINDIKKDPSFDQMIIMPNATRKLDVIKNNKTELMQWSSAKLSEALKVRGFKLGTSVEKQEVVELILRKCSNTIYWI
ncbi:hypothetical protein Glove_9g176 [Diversispora epigaea]|uniref:protein acetyllysine N-acetyltransferase n=1 Tax=Diversispora epigaea TaxID=1348612 RepID=A0A397JNK6_9GLOM|nr:hypothetical protein Glove_9g176 [Diversispora epigaea]